ncbi:MAG: hypothetical protein F4Z25_13530 [Chloroflexi bacterium]|nr:hypothetical protein [Chloroflexota bacterium]
MPRKLPTRNVGYADLNLNEFWIERLEYTETPDLHDELMTPWVRVSRPKILRSTSSSYLVTLRVEVLQDPRSVDVTIVGSFDFDPAGGGDEPSSRMLTYNGTAILFSAARGVIESVTGVSGYGRMHVPSVNIAELLDS